MSDERAMESRGAGGRYKRTGEWVTVRSFGTAEQAHLLRLVLDRAGIPCDIDNEHTGTALWHAQPAVGGIRLRVPAPFAAQANEVLEQAGGLAQETAEAAEAEDAEIEEADAADAGDEAEEESDGQDMAGDTAAAGRTCPDCHTADIDRFSWGRRFGQALLVLCAGVLLDLFIPLLFVLCAGVAVYLLMTKPDYRCLRCGKRWVAERR